MFDKRHAKTSLSCIILKKTDVDCGICSIALPKKTSKDNTSLASAIVTLLQSENLNSRDIQNRTKNNSEEVTVLQYY
jgi:ATP-dependent DNA helicase RecQ